MGQKKYRRTPAKRSKSTASKRAAQVPAPEKAVNNSTPESGAQQPPFEDTRPVWLRLLDTITNWQSFLVVAAVGLIIFSSGFNNPFRGDDDLQIVQNVPVHSIRNIGTFFTGSTFYSFDAKDPLTGQYYRPLMTTAYSAVYTIFGAQPLYFHLLQLLLMIGAVFFLYLILSFSVQKNLALLFSIIYLIHPINSQIIFAMPSMQDALMQFFGLAGLWSLIRFQSARAMSGTLLLLTLAVLSKEAGVLYVVMAFLYLLLFSRKRLKLFSIIAISILVLYVLIRSNALGGAEKVNIGPMSEAGLGARLMTIPSIISLYLGTLIWPDHLSSTYNWVVSHFAFSKVVLPLTVVSGFMAALVYVGKVLHERAHKLDYATYGYYAIWFVISLGLYSQLKPFDMTAAEPWFAIPFVGLLGMLAVTAQYLSDTFQRAGLVVASALLLLLPVLGIRTYVRGHDWASVQRLATQDISASASNYIAYNDLANYLYSVHDYTSAREAAEQSVKLYSTATNNDMLGRSCMALRDYACADDAFSEGLRHFDFSPTLINKAVLTAYYGDPSSNRDYLIKVTNKLPEQPYPWFYLALVDYTQLGRQDEARSAIIKAYGLSQDPYISSVYRTIMAGQPLNVVTN